MEVTITGLNRPITLKLIFSPHHEKAMNCVMILRLPGEMNEFMNSFYVHGAEFEGFIRALELMHRTLEGEVPFNDDDGRPRAHFTLTNRARGEITITGNFFYAEGTMLNQAGDVEDDIFSASIGAAAVLAFRGIVIDQSYIPGLIADFREALNETGVSVQPYYER
jgi:hypothetical protein